MRMLAWLALATSSALGALPLGCSGDDDPGGSGGSGTSTDTTGWWSTCVGGASVVVRSSPAACTDVCEPMGGVESVTPYVTLVGTAECDAFCAKADALGCGGSSCASNADFWCEVGPKDCAEAVKAQLTCSVEQGSWSCDGSSWTMTSSCGTFPEACGGAGGGGGG